MRANFSHYSDKTSSQNNSNSKISNSTVLWSTLKLENSKKNDSFQPYEEPVGGQDIKILLQEGLKWTRTDRRCDRPKQIGIMTRSEAGPRDSDQIPIKAT